MSNTRKVKSRPRPFRKASTLNPSTEELTRALAGKSGLFVLEYKHDDSCPTIKTQSFSNCTCEPDLQLMQYDPDKGAKR